ncbi:MAG TPA: hypothetical protein VI159_02145 [Gemmatimonadales bacterium]
MFQRDRYAPPSGHRKPDLPSPQLVVPRLRMGRTGAIVIAVHVLVLALLFWKSAELLAGSGDGPGPRGGGGGGGRQALHMFLLSGVSAPQAVAVPPAPQFTTHLPLPVPVKLDLPKLQPAPQPVETQVAVAPGTGNGTTGGPGEGPGSGGGKGAGVGPGVGNDSGPGSGGNGSYIFPASPKLMLLAPECFKGRTEARFSIDADGRVTEVALQPPPKDAECRAVMLKRFRENLFTPAMQHGVPVSSVFSITFAR